MSGTHQQSRNTDNSNGMSRDVENQSRSTIKVTDHPWLTMNTTNFTSEPSVSPSIDPYYNVYNPVNLVSSKYDGRIHSLSLSLHILTRGLIDGIGSDIQVAVPAWNKTYRLHRLILDQNAYFKLLLQGAFKEAGKDTVTLHLEKENHFITEDSFWFVLEYLYGKIEEPEITELNVKQILATCSYFQLDVWGICVDFILKQLNHTNVIDYLLFTNEFMVQGSERICDAIFTFLCREAFYMDRSILTSLPIDWLKKVIESDAFWVPSEYDRYQFIKQIIRARYDVYVNSTPSNFVLTELDTDPKCSILSKSIYYMHMTFEQLESIEKDIHPLTKQRLVPESILKEALWSQIRLRSKIESSLERNSSLDMAVQANAIRETKTEKKERLKNTGSSSDEDEECIYEDCYEHEDELPNGYYPIPTDDTTTYTGELSGSAALLNINYRKRTSPSVEQYSVYPPFRFSVEFSDVTSLKYGMRVYSDTVFYAGSNWNMYIQKTRSQRKGILQLGVYLHRQSIPQNYNQCPHTSSTEYTNNRSPSTPSPNYDDNWSFSRYSDRRKVVKTWFKIYCPTRGPKHALTLFQSSPDNFSVLQSWGWRSTTLCADEEVANNTTILNGTEVRCTSPPPPMLFTPTFTSVSRHASNTHDLRTSKSALNNSASQNTKTSAALRFTVVMSHV